MLKLLNINQVMVLYGVSRRTIYYWLDAGKMPQPVKRWGSPRWTEEQITAHLIKKEEESVHN
jgi:predicted DNA-binding transcriptional regulator AlpA